MSITASSVFAANGEKPLLITDKDTTQNSVVCYEVFGMDCLGCQSALEKQVKKIDGVADAKASFKEKYVVIDLKPGAKVSDEEIEKHIKKANFTAVGINSSHFMWKKCIEFPQVCRITPNFHCSI